MLDRTNYTSDLEKFSFKVHGRTIRLVGVSAAHPTPRFLIRMNGSLTSSASFLWGISGPFLGVYVVVQNLNIPLILQPQIFAFLCAVSWSQVGSSRLRIFSRLMIYPVFILWPKVAIKTMHHLRHHLYHGDGWIRDGDDLCRQGEHRPPRKYKLG